MRVRHVGNLGERVYRSGVGGARRADDEPRTQPGLFVGDDGFVERRRNHPVAGVDAHRMADAAAQSGHAQGLVDAVVGVLGLIDNGLRDGVARQVAGIAGRHDGG